MDIHIVVGLIIFCLAYGALLFLTLKSRKTIDLISERNLNSLREILEELRHGR